MTGSPTTGQSRIRLRETAVRHYLAGLSITATARQIGRSYGTTRTLLLEGGVTIRKQGGPNNVKAAG